MHRELFQTLRLEGSLTSAKKYEQICLDMKLCPQPRPQANMFQERHTKTQSHFFEVMYGYGPWFYQALEKAQCFMLHVRCDLSEELMHYILARKGAVPYVWQSLPQSKIPVRRQILVAEG